MTSRKLSNFLILAITLAFISAGVYHLAQPKAVNAQAIAWPIPPYTPVNISFSTSGNQTIVAAPTTGGVCVYGLSLTNSGAAATTIQVFNDGGTTPVWTTFLSASGGWAGWTLQNGNAKNPYFATNNATAFVINSSTPTQIVGGIYAATCP